MTPAGLQALACPDCDSEMVAIADGAVLHVSVAHDDSCPWLQAASDGRPFTQAIVVRPPEGWGG